MKLFSTLLISLLFCSCCKKIQLRHGISL